jgi:ABC-2 type transport system permease protein
MSSPRVIGLVAAREIRTRLGSRAFRITTGVLLVALVALIVVLNITSGGSSAKEVGLTPSTSSLAQPLQNAARATGDTVRTPVVSEQAGTRQVHDGDLDALVVGLPDSFHVIVDKGLDDDVGTLLAALARQEALDRQVRALGGNPAQVSREVAGARLDVTALEPKEPHHDERVVIGILVGILIYLALLTYGQTVAQGVVEEKTSRVVELLLSTIRAWQLMAGKVLGIGLVGLLQLALLIGAGVIAGLATGQLTLPASIAAGTIAWAIVWYLLGFFLYALLFAAAGALVSRQEDVGGVTMPLMILIIAPYVIGVSALPADPDNGPIAALSIIPLFAPMLMPMREAMGVASPFELVLSVALTVALIAILVRATGRIYRNAVMRTGARVRLTDALRGA